MTDPQQPDTPRQSRMADQPAPRPVHPAPAQGDRPTYDQLTAQADSTDYSPLAEHLDDEARSALGLPAAPGPLTIDHQLAQRIRAYLLDHPTQVAELPDSVRDLIHL